jgi:2-hydroxy-3-oxopropionate reductase
VDRHPRERAATDAILVMLPDLPELEAALDGEDGLLAGYPTAATCSC